MRRFVENRWWAFLLAFVVALGIASVLPSPSSAITVRGAMWSSNTNGDSGDPDIPGGSGGVAIPRVGVQPTSVGGGGQRVGGDNPAMTPSLERTLRLKIVLEMLRALVFHN